MSSTNQRDVPKPVFELVQDMRASRPQLNLPPGASDADRNYAYASLAAQVVAYQGRIADALEGIYATQVILVRQRFESGVPWAAFWIVIVFALMAIAALAFSLGLK